MPHKRQRRSGNRSSGGRPRTPPQPIMTEQQIAHRQRLAPGIPMEDLMKQRAGVPLETLAAMRCPDFNDGRMVIGETHRLAGEQFANLVQRWRRLHQIPDDTRQRAGVGRGQDVDPRHVETINARMAEVESALDGVPPFAGSVVESICIDDFMGRAVDNTPIGRKIREALREGLTALCGVFRVHAKRAA
jgi:hypothetical protein